MTTQAPLSEIYDPVPTANSSSRWPAAFLCAAAGLILVASLAAAGEPAKPYDRCAYMNPESKAYEFCRSQEAAAKQRVEAAPAPTPVPAPKPEQQPKS